MTFDDDFGSTKDGVAEPHEEEATPRARPEVIRPVEAKYVPASHPLYSGNPLVDALPPVRSYDEWVEQLINVPAFDEAQRAMDAHLRSYFISKLKRLFIPTAQHVKLARKIDQLVRWGYESRNPLSPNRAALLQQTYERAQTAGQAVKLAFSDVHPICTASVIGGSGVGKTTAVEHVLSSYPQCIHHVQHNITQLVWLKVECPKDGSVRELALSALRAIDNALGTHYAPAHEARQTATSLTRRFSHLAVAHHLGILVLDEMQNLSVKKSGGREEMLNWFQELVNELKLPILLLGTYKARRVLQLDMRHARRVSVAGSEIWDPLKKGEEFDFLLNAMWQYMWLRESSEVSDELRATIYEESQGIRAFVVDMFLVAQLYALWKGVETITPELFRKVARTEFAAVQPMLHALRSGDPNRLHKFDDLVTYDVDDQIERVRQLITTTSSADTSVRPSAKASMLAQASANAASTLGLSAADARDLVLRAMDESHKSAPALTLAAIELYRRSQQPQQGTGEADGSAESP